MYQEDVLGYSVLREHDLEKIHEATLDIMEDYGIKVDAKDAREIYEAAGCTVDPETHRVKFPRKLVNDAIQSTPGEILLAGRDPKNDVKLSGKKVIFKNFATGVQVIDPETQVLRDSTKEDLGNIARFCEALDEVGYFTLAVAANDIDPEIRDLYEAEVVLNNTTKHFSHDTHSPKSARQFIEMAAAIVGGKEKLRERPIVSLGTCPVSPLTLIEDCTDQIKAAAEVGIPINILSMGLAGGTTPVTLAGTLVVTNAEILAGVVFSQLINKGNPVIYGTSNTIMDMRFTTSPVGAPEQALFSAAVGQIGHYYEIPTQVGGT